LLERLIAGRPNLLLQAIRSRRLTRVSSSCGGFATVTITATGQTFLDLTVLDEKAIASQ